LTAYNFEADPKTHRPIGRLIRALKGKNEKLYELSEDLVEGSQRFGQPGDF